MSWSAETPLRGAVMGPVTGALRLAVEDALRLPLERPLSGAVASISRESAAAPRFWATAPPSHGARALTTSAGVAKRSSCFLAIILATTADTSGGTSGQR